MKVFIHNLKSWLILIVSVLLVGIFIFSCSSTPRDGETTTTTTTTTGRGDKDTDEDEGDLACSLPECNGSKCCNKGSKKEKEQCEEWCEDDLNLDSDGEELCLTLDRDTVDSLVFIFDDNEALKEPDDEELVKNIKDSDISLICSAVKELGSRIWSRLIDNYGGSQAKAVLGWVAEEKDVVQIFEKAEDEDGIEMFKTLLEKAGGSSSGSGDNRVVAGLNVDFDFNDDDNNNFNVLNRALDNNNDKLLKFIHRDVLEDSKAGICGEKKKSNWPEPEKSATASDGFHYKEGSGGGDDADRQKQRACILGVYCKVAERGEGTTEDDNRDNSLREDLAKKLSDSGMESFIERKTSDGGLSHDTSGAHFLSEDDAEEWTYKVCKQLKCLWKNGGLDLGLGTEVDADGCDPS